MIRASIIALALLGSTTAHAGWTAKQTSSTDGKEESADLYFENDLFRIDPDKSTSVIIDLNKGNLTFLNHEKKKHAEITLEDAIKLRDEQISKMEQNVP